MPHAPRLSPAGLLAALASVVVLSCGSDTIDLLPPLTGANSGGSANNAGTAAAAGANVGGATAGSSSSISGGTAGNAGSFAGSGGNSGFGGQGGRNGNCLGDGCGGDMSFGGTFSIPCETNGVSTCTPCLSDDQCPIEQHCYRNVCLQCWNDKQCNTGFSCDTLVHRCAPSCQETFECRDGRVCDPTQGACVACLPNGDQCPNPSSDPEAHICYLRRCVECESDQDCPLGRHLCVAYHCIECVTDKDCGDGSAHCDRGSGHCQP